MRWSPIIRKFSTPFLMLGLFALGIHLASFVRGGGSSSTPPADADGVILRVSSRVEPQGVDTAATEHPREETEVSGPCGELVRLVSGVPEPEGGRRLVDLLGKLPVECIAHVPRSWQAATAEALCIDGSHDVLVPGAWALQALSSKLRARPSDSALVSCLAGRAAQVESGHAPELASLLARCTSHLPPLYANTEADPFFLELAAEILSTRPPTDLGWWREFWTGMTSSGGVLRQYLYLAIGERSGFEDLRAFMESTIEWEDPEVEVGEAAAPRAGCILRRFWGPVEPEVDLLVPDSPQMRRVIVYGIPFEGLSPLAELPWLATNAAQERIRALWEGAEGVDQGDLSAWRVSYIGNQWVLAGSAIALDDLKAAFPEEGEGALVLDIEARVRFLSALLAAIRFSGSRRAEQNRQAESIHTTLQRAVRRAALHSLVSLVYYLKPVLELPGVRDELGVLLQDRLHELPDKAQSLIAR